MSTFVRKLGVGVAMASLSLAANTLFASSHMDAPLITLDPAANTTDVYAFVTERGGEKFLVTALGVYPHQEPGIGPNKYNFDDNVRYTIALSVGDDVGTGRASLRYQFDFDTQFRNQNTILQSYLGQILEVGDENQNLVQTYRVTRIDRRPGARKPLQVLGSGIVPPNNQGIATPLYNQDNDGKNPAKDGVATAAELDTYTAQSIATLDLGYRAFAGQRDDGFFADIQSVFDLLQLRDPGEDSQGGFNIHLIALEIPVAELGGETQVVGVHGRTLRRRLTIRSNSVNQDAQRNLGPFVQVGRQGNPLFNEGFVAIKDKDLYSRTTPTKDQSLFRQYALNPELGALINAILLGGTNPGIAIDRTDIAGIYIPDVIKVDLSTPAARLAGGGPDHPTNRDDDGFSRLSIFGGDVLQSQVQDPFNNGGFIPGGWPNGRRFGDDVLDIAVDAVLSDLRVVPPVINTFDPGDGVSQNDIAFNKVFPYEGTPQNGRNHDHP